MNRFYLCVLLLFVLVTACRHTIKELDPEPRQPLIFGAIYIACDSPPWITTVDGFLACQQQDPARLGLNPINACAFETIADEDGSLSITFSNNSNLGRIVVTKIKDDITLTDQNGISVDEVYINESDHVIIEKNNLKLRVTVKNAYVGGCFHELIQWEEVE